MTISLKSIATLSLAPWPAHMLILSAEPQMLGIDSAAFNNTFKDHPGVLLVSTTDGEAQSTACRDGQPQGLLHDDHSVSSASQASPFLQVWGSVWQRNQEGWHS